MEWLSRAAQDDYAIAQIFLARLLLRTANKDDHLEKAIFWLKKAAEADSVAGKVWLAWVLSIYPDAKIRDNIRTLILNKSAEVDYADKAHIYEVMATAYAETGDFIATQIQHQAIKWAEPYK